MIYFQNCSEFKFLELGMLEISSAHYFNNKKILMKTLKMI